jgi:hypothetical protein
MRNVLSMSLCSALTVSCAILLGGCEDEPNMRGVSGYFDQNPIASEPRAQSPIPELVINPVSKSVADNGETTAFAAQGGAPPYVWSVNDISKGSILEQGQGSAVYQRAAAGDNVVICTDSRGNRGFATISQP